MQTKQSIITAPQLPSNYKNAQQSIFELEQNMNKKPEQVDQQVQQPTPPKFLTELNDVDVIEGESIHFSTRVEPVGDESMRIEWYFNGKPLVTGSRVHTSDDFGFVSLDMDYVFARDGGEYLCRAVNKWGFSSTRGRVTVKGEFSAFFIFAYLYIFLVVKIKEPSRPDPLMAFYVVMRRRTENSGFKGSIIFTLDNTYLQYVV